MSDAREEERPTDDAEALRETLRRVREGQHTLASKLAIASGFAELLEADPALPADLREMARLSHQGAREATAVLEELQQMIRRALAS